MDGLKIPPSSEGASMYSAKQREAVDLMHAHHWLR